MTYSPLTWADNDATKPVSAARMTQHDTGIYDAHVVPAARVTHNAAQSVASATPTALAFNTERYDQGALHDNVTNNSRLTIVTPGIYLVVANIEWAVNATGARTIDLRVNGTTIIGSRNEISASASVVTRQQVVAPWQFAAADYVEAVATQTSGVALNVQLTSALSPEFSIGLISYL